jgi:hypothetical protein
VAGHPLTIPLVSPKRYCEAPVEAMTPAEWQACEIRNVSLGELIPSQPFLVIDRFTAIALGGAREGGDPLPYSVEFRGQLYLHNGHHHWALAVARGARRIYTRVVRADRSCDGRCGCAVTPAAE